ncbi:MAG TPA: UDP-N-acetylmuramoyl-tripeptide--D-alanyl-D-alanine ligase, partial [Solirubrobacteraceae bacterium]|nr:UDP-N-acetylmuramoyl-tripeptide--D-alanyl-D-alanine ligase [Solirubrobacteraceae bacterium]
MRLTTPEVAAATGGEQIGPAIAVEGVALDSRRVSGGELFVPLRAERDGHAFIAAAMQAGAAAYLTEHGANGGPAVRVDDTLRALTALASVGRERFGGEVVGITGSVGKTTTKDLLAAALAPGLRVHANIGSYNNALGVPHTILGAPEGTDVLITELGANAPGEISDHCALARPTIGVVTRVASAHTEGFGGGLEAVARAKGELIAALPDTGVAVLNADDPRVAAMRSLTGARVVTFGEQSGEVSARVLGVDADLRPTLDVQTPWGSVEIHLGVRGAHQAVNAAATVAVGGILGVELAAMARALEAVQGPTLRMDLRRAPSGLIVLDDSYNANPASMQAALRALMSVPADRRVAVLGAMAELGSSSADEHARISRLGDELGVELLSVGAPEYGVPDFPDAAAARAALGPLGEGDAVLIKGSRRAGL